MLMSCLPNMSPTDTQGDLVKQFESNTPFDGLQITGETLKKTTKTDTKAETKTDAILEVVRTAKGLWEYYKDRDLREQEAKDMVIGEFEPTRLIIHSLLLIQTIREMVTYYPSQELTDETLKIMEPYPVLIHHHDELKKLHE